MLVDVVKRGTEAHVVFYGFSAAGEDSVNPQLFVSRILLPLGYEEFTRRVSFFDHSNHMYFRFPIQPLAQVPATLGSLSPPFFVHVREPEYSSVSLIAKYFNRARVTPMDLGLRSFRSYQVDEFAPAGPIPIQSLPEEARAPVRAEFAAYEEGFCVTTWFQDAGEYSPLVHQDASLPEHLNRLLLEARSSPSNRYLNVSRKFTTAAEEIFGRSAVAYLTGYFDNQTGRLLRATLNVVADDEIAVAVNDQAIFESFGWRPTARIAEKVLLPPGLSQVKVIYHKFWNQGGFAFAAVDEESRPIAWKCDRAFH